MSSKATIEIMGKKYTGSGDSVKDALMAIPYAGFAGFRAILTVGEKTIILHPVQTMRLFSKSPLTKEIAVKNTAMQFE